VVSGEQDAVAEEGESGAAVHLRLLIFVLVFTPLVRPLRNGRVTAAVTAGAENLYHQAVLVNDASRTATSPDRKWSRSVTPSGSGRNGTGAAVPAARVQLAELSKRYRPPARTRPRLRPERGALWLGAAAFVASALLLALSGTIGDEVRGWLELTPRAILRLVCYAAL
jgi:hypothetical protein